MIVITTPTGAIGKQLLENLLDSGEALRVIVRDPQHLPPEMQRRVDVVQGSHGDADTVNAAFAGADSVFWVVPPSPRMKSVDEAYVAFTRPASAAFLSHGVKRVVGVSALGRGSPFAGEAGMVTGALRMNDLIAGTGVGYRALIMPSFMENLLRQVEPIRSQGQFFLPISGDRKLPTCASRDIAAAAARLLLDRSWSGSDSVPVLGPEDLSFNDMAAILSEVLGKPVRFQQIPLVAHKAGLMAHGMSEAFADGVVEMMAAKDKGLDNAEPRTPEATTPTSFRQWCEEVLKPAVLN